MADITSDHVDSHAEDPPVPPIAASEVADVLAPIPDAAIDSTSAPPSGSADTDGQRPDDASAPAEAAPAVPAADEGDSTKKIIAQAFRSAAVDAAPEKTPLSAAMASEGDGDKSRSEESPSDKIPGDIPKFRAIEDKTLDRVQAVFVPPPDYASKIDSELLESRVFIVQGSAQAGKLACAIHLGLRFYGEMAHGTAHRTADVYTRYEEGLEALKRRFKQQNIPDDRISPLDSSLIETIEKSRDYGDEPSNRADRARIIRQLDRLALIELHVTFIEVCAEGQRRSRSIVSCETCDEPLRDSQALIDLLEKHEASDKTVCIVENVFSNNIEPASMLPKVQSIAEEKNLCVILTTTWPKRRVRGFDVPVVALDMPEDSRATFMRKIFDSHIHFYQEIRHINERIVELSRKEQEVLLKDYLEYPSQINLFCVELSELPPEAEVKELRELAERIGRVDLGVARAWFKSLSDNEKLYAMLIFLFPGIGRLDLDEIYTLAVQSLRSDGFAGLADPRAIGLIDMLKVVRAHEDEGQVVFNAPVFEEEIRNQIHNHHHLLWSFIHRVFPELITLYQAAEYWRLRRSLGKAIGRVGIYHIHKLDDILRALAHHSSGGVVATAGYALDEICRAGPSYYAFVTRLLQRWVDSEDADLMWAAGASIWRIYDGLAETSVREREIDGGTRPATAALKTVWEILARLIERFSRFRDNVIVRDTAGQGNGAAIDPVQLLALKYAYRESRSADNVGSILHAIRYIALNHPADAIPQIIEWLGKDRDSTLRLLAETAARMLFDELTNPASRLLEDRHEPMLQLIGPLLSAEDETLQAMMAALLAWTRQGGWAEKIQRGLLRVVNHATPQDARELRTRLATRWLVGSSEEARRIAQAIIARSYAMEGVPMDVPGQRYGVLILDGSYEASKNQLGMRAGHQLYERLNTHIDMYVALMGNDAILAQPGRPLQYSNLHSRHTRSRLMLPSLEHLDPARCYFALVLTWGPIADFEDAWNTLWRERLIVVPVQSQVEWSPELRTVAVGRLLPEQDLRAIEAAACVQQAQALALLTPDQWWADLRVTVDTDDDKALTTKLAAWIEELDDASSVDPSHDLARSIICAMLGLASADLPRCVRLICVWLAGESKLARLIGQACGKALFILHADQQPVPLLPHYEALLDLVVPLAQQGWSGAEAALYAARRWAAQPAWAERLLARPDGHASEMSQLVDVLLPEHRDQLRTALQGWSQPLPGEPDKEAPRLVLSLAEQLLLRIWVGAHSELPALPDSSSYGIIIVDVFSQSPRSRTRLAKIASLLAQRINDSYREQIHLQIYRLGQDAPVAGPGEKPATIALAPAGLAGRPRLLGPLLERYSVPQVGFMLLLINEQFLDEQDWHTTPWSACARIYRDEDRRQWNAPFPVIKRQETVEEAATYILDQLALASERGT